MAKTFNLLTYGVGGGGGNFPHNVSNFVGTALDDTITLKWTDPSEEEALDWIGTIVRIKVGSYPAHERDGIAVVDSMVRDAYKETGFEITGLENGSDYYIQAFPYSETGISNNNANRIPPIRIEFIYPSALINFKLESGDEKLTPIFTLPANATSCRLVYKTGSTPANMNDGTVIEPATSGTAITGLVNDTEYYFRAFPKNQFGRYNEEIAGNTASAAAGDLIPRNGLIAEYTMDSVSGNTLLDTSNSGTAYNGTIGSNVTFPVGKIGNCANFPNNATTGAISFTDPVIPQGAKSISGWIYINAFVHGGRVIDTNDTSNRGFNLLTLSTGGNGVRFDLGNGSAIISIEVRSLVVNTWYYFCYIWDGTNTANRIKLLFNGAWKYATFSGTESTNPYNLRMGTAPIASGAASNVRLDQTRIYNRALTEDEAILLANEVVGV